MFRSRSCPSTGFARPAQRRGPPDHDDGRFLAVLVEATGSAFLSRDQHVVRNRLRSVDIETRPAFRFTNETLLKASGFNVVIYYRDYDVTEDGKKMVMVFPVESETRSSGVINVVLNWTEELRRLVPIE